MVAVELYFRADGADNGAMICLTNYVINNLAEEIKIKLCNLFDREFDLANYLQNILCIKLIWPMGCRSRASGRTCGGSPTLRPRRSVRDRGVQLRNRSGARPSRSPRGVGHRPAVRRPRCQRRCAAREEWFCKGARGSGSVPAGAGGAKLSAAPAACPPVREAAQA